MILSPQQQRVMDALIPVAEIATDGSRENLTVMPRCHSLIVGPSGSGKSYVARKIAEELGLPCIVEPVPEPSPLGRGQGCGKK